MAKYVRVNIKHNGVIPILGCWGPIKNVLLTEVQAKNIQHVLGEDKVEFINKPKKEAPKQETIKIKVEEIVEIKPVQQEAKDTKEEPDQQEQPQEVIEEVKVEEPDQQEE